jgi:hypothetical protein
MFYFSHYTKTKPLTGTGQGFLLVEVAGQLIHIFRYGLDYAFIQSLKFYIE